MILELCAGLFTLNDSACVGYDSEVLESTMLEQIF